MTAFARRQPARGARANKRGFTLIELLVIIAVIALLVAILVPNLRAALEYARLVLCRVNMRNLSMSCTMYVEENNEIWVPSDLDRLNSIKHAYLWGWPAHLIVAGTLEGTGILACPGFSMPFWPGKAEEHAEDLRVSAPDTWLYDKKYLWGNYSLHTHSHNSSFYIKDWHFSSIFPERQIIMAEAVNAFGHPSSKPKDRWYGTHHGPEFDSEINITFSDGSIESIEHYSDTDKWNWEHASNPFYYYPWNDRYSWGFWRAFKHGAIPK
jgi:prepilin-type N-terminal cleavage/methylation domain-containing protein